MPQTNCPKCGGIGMCYCTDISTAFTYADQYTFVCFEQKCLHVEDRKESGGEVAKKSWPTKCPFCGKYYNEHLGIPTQTNEKEPKKKERKKEVKDKTIKPLDLVKDFLTSPF